MTSEQWGVVGFLALTAIVVALSVGVSLGVAVAEKSAVLHSDRSTAHHMRGGFYYIVPESEYVKLIMLRYTTHSIEVPVPTIQDLFTQVTGDDTSVAADQAKLDADTTADVADHAGLNAAVTAPTLVKTADGTFVALIPNATTGKLDNVVLIDGTATPVPSPTPAPTPPVTS